MMNVNNFTISMMRRDGMSIAEISAKTGLEPEVITKRLRAYEGHDSGKRKDEFSQSVEEQPSQG